MNPRTVLRSMITFIVMLFLSATAHAQLFRSYLSVAGNDANPCTLPAPCRLLPAALAAVADGGEIWMLDSANFNTGPVAITKSVTILAVPGALGSVVAQLGGDAITIATAGVKVALRNLVIVSMPGGDNTDNNHGTVGINMTNGARLAIENCVISNFSPNAVFGLKVAAAAMVRVVNSLFRDNSYGAFISGGATASISGSQFLGNGYGIYVSGSIPATVSTAAISETVLSGGGYGVLAYVPSPVSTSTVKVSVTRSAVTNNNSSGVLAEADVVGGTATLTLSDSTVTGNWVGLTAGGAGTATLKTAGNNTVSENNTPTLGTITSIGTM